MDNRVEILNAPYSLSLYIHIPFCSKKCLYCDFYSEETDNLPLISRVLEDTLAQLRHFRGRCGEIRFTTIFIGGGTPSLIPAGILDEFLGGVLSITGRALEEFSIEANPESVSSDFMSVCRRNRVSRLSLGIQTFDPGCLKTLGRITTPEKNHGAMERISREWAGDINMDLMAGIPGQTSKILTRDLETAFYYSPDHISFYSLTLEEGTPLKKLVDRGKIKPVSHGDALWLTGCGLLEKAGYNNYEISNFSPPGKECRHNLKYWHMTPYLGIGPGAVSTLPSRDGIVRLQNPKGLDIFHEIVENSGSVPVEHIKAGDFLFENIIMGFRLKEGIPKKIFLRRFNKSFPELFPRTWEKWTSSGAAGENETHYFLKGNERWFLNSRLVELLNEPEAVNEVIVNWPERT